ncbi:unnamed protein product, partial [Pylaiella littoralis]
KLAELEVVLEGAIREHTLFRARAEDRLEALRATVEEDSQENRPQFKATLSSLLIEKNVAKCCATDDLRAADKVRSESAAVAEATAERT